MRYIHKKDERLSVRDDMCTCGHAPEAHLEEIGSCSGLEPESGESCPCTGYEPEEMGAPLGRDYVEG